ncbi:hypothetical protein ABT173_48350 [Streptomyces sp. NPDC001795]|uniref:hypothetical protein n=1 Tax=Streptomyces sp. NPDC001795 TaxID=3154525 RepID=UPI00331D1C6F
MKTIKEEFDELAQDEGAFSLLLTGEQARATLRALDRTPKGEVDGAVARDQLKQLLHVAPYDLPDADALEGLRVSSRQARRRRER